MVKLTVMGMGAQMDDSSMEDPAASDTATDDEGQPLQGSFNGPRTDGHAAVQLFFRLNHARQTVDYVNRQVSAWYCSFGNISGSSLHLSCYMNLTNPLSNAWLLSRYGHLQQYNQSHVFGLHFKPYLEVILTNIHVKLKHSLISISS